MNIKTDSADPFINKTKETLARCLITYKATLPSNKYQAKFTPK